MSATVDTNTDWQDQAVALRRDHAMATAEIAERFGKSASQVRRVLSAANTERAVNGADIPGQTTVDDHLEPEPESNLGDLADPANEYWDGDLKADPLDEFRGEAGDPVSDMPKQPEPEATHYETRLAGTQQQAFDFGPESELPVGGTLKVKSDKLASGFYGLGDVITGTFTARIVDVTGAERFQRASEEYRIQPQGHVALITEITVKPS